MNLKNMLGAASLNKEDENNLIPLFTPWGENPDSSNVLSEYPRPQMRRKNYTMLNGIWDYRIMPKEPEESVEPGKEFVPDGQILVPFSPESRLSGVNRQLQPKEQLWYQRRVIPENPGENGKRCIFHFDAVDYDAEVYINGKPVVKHSGGYLPFEVDITDAILLNAAESLLIQVCVRDDSDASYHSRGKQKLKRGSIFYSAQSGIWQSVWYEWVPDNYIKQVEITPDYDKKQVEIRLEWEKSSSSDSKDAAMTKDSVRTKNSVVTKSSAMAKEHVRIRVGEPELYIQNGEARGENDSSLSPDRREVPMEILSADMTDTEPGCCTCLCALPEEIPFLSWTPEHPYLYPLFIDAGEDHVESYFAMRTVDACRDENGILRFYLNHEPLFLNGVLDQGYWPDGLMTAPSDEALVYDIHLAKSLGFNMIRKHIKVEPLRWYYHCDRLGVIVWQDMVNGGSSYNIPLVSYLVNVLPFMGKHIKDNHYRLLSRESREGREEWERECHDTVKHLKSVPSIAIWGLFNEGWGQFDSMRITEKVRAQDPTRLIDSASGWFDQGAGDFRSVHNYFRKLKVEKSPNRIFAITEYGGVSWQVKGHASTDSVYGYQKIDSPEKMECRFRELQATVESLVSQGLSAAVYTQLSDIEEEVNGLVTYDRKVVKIRLD